MWCKKLQDSVRQILVRKSRSENRSVNLWCPRGVRNNASDWLGSRQESRESSNFIQADVIFKFRHKEIMCNVIDLRNGYTGAMMDAFAAIVPRSAYPDPYTCQSVSVWERKARYVNRIWRRDVETRESSDESGQWDAMLIKTSEGSCSILDGVQKYVGGSRTPGTIELSCGDSLSGNLKILEM